MKYLKVFFVTIFGVFISCSGYDRVVEEASKSIPRISILEAHGNCPGEFCDISGKDEVLENDRFTEIQGLLEAKMDLFFSRDSSVVPYLEFSITGIDREAVKKLSYLYYKKDVRGKVLYKSIEKTLEANDGVYKLRYNVEDLAPSIARSYPEETHYIDIIIYDNESNRFTSTVSFKVKSLETDAIHIQRSESVADLPYYTSFVPDDTGTFVVDMLDITNVEDRSFVIDGNIGVVQKTSAMLLAKSYEQNVVNIGIPSTNYPRNIFEWSVVEVDTVSYRKAEANGVYSVFVLRGTELSPLNFELESFDDELVLKIHNLEIGPNESVKLLLTVKYSINETLLGNHGSVNFYQGHSFYNAISSPVTCNYFYTYLPYQGGGFTEGAYYFALNAQIAVLANVLYSDCPDFSDNPNISQTLSIITHPEIKIDLMGRYHSLQTRVEFSVKEQGYDGDAFLHVNKNFELLEQTVGEYDETLLNYDYVYRGFVM